MAYIVNKTDGTVLATVADGVIDTSSSSLTILGKGFNNYGEIVAEDLVHMMEHFSSTTAPANAIRGQLWFDATAPGVLKVNLSDVFGVPDWVPLPAIVQGIEPSTGFDIGTFWYDSAKNLLHISVDGVTFTPLKTVSVGTPPSSPAEGDLFYDTTRKELQVYNANLHGLGSAGFDVVGPPIFSGSQPSSPADGDMWWDSGNKQFYIYDSVVAEFRLVGPDSPGGASALPGGVTTTKAVSIDGNAVLEIFVEDDIVGIWSKKDFTPLALIPNFHNGVLITALKRGLNLATKAGPTSEPTRLNGTATEALYAPADLAERYAVDNHVTPGELVSFGGEVELTKTTAEEDFNIFGVVSTEPGLKLNEFAGPDETHPYIALTGRVPCKVFGSVTQGDRLVSSDIPGVAKAISQNDLLNLYPAVFGRALETNIQEGLKTIEVVVGVK